MSWSMPAAVWMQGSVLQLSNDSLEEQELDLVSELQ